jgi:hypothetical protein
MTNTTQSPTSYVRLAVAVGKLTKLDIPQKVRAFRVVHGALVDAQFLIGESTSGDGLQGIPVWAESLVITNGVPVWLDARKMSDAGSGIGDLVLEMYSDANVAQTPQGPIFDAPTVIHTRSDQNLSVLAGARRTLFSQNDNTLHTRFRSMDVRRTGSLYFAGEVHSTTAFAVALLATQLATGGEVLLAPLITAGANSASAGGFVANLNDGWPGRRLVPLTPCKVEYISIGADALVSYRLGFVSR